VSKYLEGSSNPHCGSDPLEPEGVTEFTNVDPWTLWGFKQPGLGTALTTVSADGILVSAPTTAPLGHPRAAGRWRSRPGVAAAVAPRAPRLPAPGFFPLTCARD